MALDQMDWLKVGQNGLELAQLHAWECQKAKGDMQHAKIMQLSLSIPPWWDFTKGIFTNWIPWDFTNWISSMGLDQ